MDIENYMSALVKKLKDYYGTRLAYVGLQGSYLRGEETEESDIDVMAVINGLSRSDMDGYRSIIASTDEPEKACGFICGVTDIENWNALEICHLLHGTKDYCGTLKTLVPSYTEENIRNFVKLSVNNLYHELCHGYIYGGPQKSAKNLPGTYKSVFFILQNLYYLQTGDFVRTKTELANLLSGKSKAVLERSMAMAAGSESDFNDSFDLLLSWCQEVVLLT